MYRPKVMLDSGAFSVWTRGVEIDVDDYADFCLEHAENIWVPVGLDVLPGRPGDVRTPQMTEDAAAASYRNNVRMRSRGVENVIPVFHQGESLDWLERYVKEGFDYIGISPNKRCRTSQKVAWLDQVFGFLCGGGGYPPVRCHAFGETSRQIIFGYPWASVDSTSWVIVGGMGQVFVPQVGDDGEYRWFDPHIVLPISTGLDGKGSKIRTGRRAWEGFGKDRQEAYLKYFEFMGFTLEELQTIDVARKRLNVRFYKELGSRFTHRPFESKMGSGFLTKRSKGLGVDSWQWDEGLDFVYVSGITQANLFMCVVEEVEHILISYQDVRTARRDIWENINDVAGFIKDRYRGNTGYKKRRVRL